MVDISAWMSEFLQKLSAAFGERVWFVGLQGSYSRGEATPESDIDAVVILEELSAKDIQIYNAVLDNMPHRERICGFFSGKAELINWTPSDLFQFCYDTVPIVGSLDEILASVDENAVNEAISLGACNIYHACVHNMLHEKSDDVLRALYKAASFVVQAIVFKQSGSYVKHLAQLLKAAQSDECEIINTFLRLKNGQAIEFVPMAEALFAWSKKWICEYGSN